MSSATGSEVLQTGSLWTVQDAEDYRSMPFWPLRSRAERVGATVAAYRSFEVIELSAEERRHDCCRAQGPVSWKSGRGVPDGTTPPAVSA